MKGIGKKLLAVFLACAMMIPMTVSALAVEEQKESNSNAPLAITSDGQSFVTYTYSDGAHTDLIAGPCEEIYSGPAPM